MRISVLIPSRGRPRGLVEAVLSAHLKESGAHGVTYVIGCDAGDDETIAMALSLRQGGLPVIPRVGARQSSLGGLNNLLAERFPGDVYCTLGDDVRVLTEGWDEVIADAWRKETRGVWWWQCRGTDGAFPIVSERWRAAAGRIFTSYFPFWYDDVWLIELQRYVTGGKGDRLNAWIEDGAAGTHRMRDLAFWDEFFWSRRAERRAEARAIAEKLGYPPVESLDDLDLGKNLAFDAAGLEAKQGDRGPPTPEYLAALGHAKALLQKEVACN